MPYFQACKIFNLFNNLEGEHIYMDFLCVLCVKYCFAMTHGIALNIHCNFSIKHFRRRTYCIWKTVVFRSRQSVISWRAEISSLNPPCCWINVPWLFSVRYFLLCPLPYHMVFALPFCPLSLYCYLTAHLLHKVGWATNPDQGEVKISILSVVWMQTILNQLTSSSSALCNFS